MSPPEQDSDVLDYGQQAVEYPIGVALDDSAIADPLQSKPKRKPGKKRRPRGQTVVLVAAGFAGYGSEDEEIEAIKNNRWVPHTDDFRATAAFSTRGFFDVHNADEFVGALGENVQGQMARVVFIGHGSPRRLGLSGRREGTITRFSQFIDAAYLSERAGYILQRIEPKLEKEATIDLVACEAALGESFMQSLANAFKRCVRGFSGPVYWKHSINKEGTKVVDRGLVSSDNKRFHKGISGLRFDQTVCLKEE